MNVGQYGGCPGKDAWTVNLIKELCHDYSQITQTPFMDFADDADNCHNRILVNLASLVSKDFGVHNHVVCAHAETLEQAKYKLKML